MKTNELVDCIENGGILERFDEVQELLCKKQFTERFDEDQIADVLMAIRASLEEQKEFQKLLQLVDRLKAEQAGVYEAYHYIFDDFLVDYHCYFTEFDKLTDDFY